MERNEEIKNFIAELHELLASNTPAFVKISHALFMAKVKNFHKDLAYESFYDFAYDEFGLQKTSVKDYFSVAESFLVEDWTHFGSDGHAYREPELKPDYKDFSFYQLVELVPISSSERPLIKPDMTIRQIREWKRNHKLVSVNNTWKLWGELTDKEKQQYEVQQTKTKDENGSSRTSDQVKKCFQEELITAVSEYLQSFCLRVVSDKGDYPFEQSFVRWLLEKFEVKPRG